MKAFLIKCCVLLALLAMAASGASADVGYVNPPTTFDPQRTMFWTFGTSNWETPIMGAGPTWGIGDWACDKIEFSENLQWYPENLNFPSHQGMIGLDNTQGATEQAIWVTFHINNYVNQNRIKKLWYEATMVTWDNTEDWIQWTLPDDTFWSKIDDECLYEALDPGPGVRENELYHITPNPDWEEISWQAVVPAGSGILIDSIFISTACVPEPSALLALGSGLVGLIGFTSRKRRA